jgi:hypothetical protein
MRLMQCLLEQADRMVSATWDLRRCALSYRLYIVTPRQGRHTVRRRLLRKLLKETTMAHCSLASRS